MPVSSAAVDLLLGNVEGRIVGPAPSGILDRELNRHLPWNSPQLRGQVIGPPALVYDPLTQRYLMGALSRVKAVLRRHGVRYRIRDTRHSSQIIPETRWQLRGPELRDYQRQVVERAVEVGAGVIDIGTGGGKTLLAAAILARLQLPSLYIVTSRPLLSQAVQNLRDYLGVEPGVVGSGVHRPRPLTVALIQALSVPQMDLTPWKNGCLVFDEGHHACAPTFLQTVRTVNARYNYFLSAVPFRPGADQAVLDALTGGSLTGRQYSAEYLIANGYACPAEVQVERCAVPEPTLELPFRLLYQCGIVENAERNHRIVELARQHADRGASVLILVERVRHGEALNRATPDSAFVHGGTPKGSLHRYTEQFRARELRCLIATSALFQEGVSIDGIEILIQAGGLKSRNKVLQSIGRGLRRQPGKSRCLYVDFLDEDKAGMLLHHSLQRLRTLGDEGFPVPPVRLSTDSTGPLPSEEEIAPVWSHVRGTKRFLLIDGEGQTLGQAFCVDPEAVPAHFCRGCDRRARCRMEE